MLVVLRMTVVMGGGCYTIWLHNLARPIILYLLHGPPGVIAQIDRTRPATTRHLLPPRLPRFFPTQRDSDGREAGSQTHDRPLRRRTHLRHQSPANDGGAQIADHSLSEKRKIERRGRKGYDINNGTFRRTHLR